MRLSKQTLRPDRHTRRLEARAGNAGGLPTHMIRKLLKRLPSHFGRPAHRRTTPAVIPASQHYLKRNHNSLMAGTLVDRLQKDGYQAFVFGGCVRDLRLDLDPKDYDVATSAPPEQVRATFRNSRLIGRRFKLAHVLFGREIIEVATFR